MGPGSATADSCDEYYLFKDSYVTTLKLYHRSGEGIVGTLFVLSNGDYKINGDIRAAD
jgi:hypothetical protein